MHGETIHKGGTSGSDRKRKESSRRNQPSNSGELRIDPQADQEVGEPTEPERTAFGCGIYPAAKRDQEKANKARKKEQTMR